MLESSFFLNSSELTTFVGNTGIMVSHYKGCSKQQRA